MLPRLVVASAVLLLASGCANTITERITLAETCQGVLDETNAAPTLETTRSILKARLGAVASCPDDASKLLMVCAYDDMQRRLDIKKRSELIAAKYDVVKTKVEALGKKLDNELRALDGKLKQTSASCTVRETRRQCSASMIAKAAAELRSSLSKDLPALYTALIDLHDQITAEQATLPTEVARELVAWDANVKAQLEGFQQALGGDIRALALDTARTELMRYSARRSLDLLHRALRPADAALMKADEKAYGTVSLGYWAFGGNVQDAVNQGYTNAVKRFQARFENSGQDEAALRNGFQLALQRAACENVSGDTQYTILTELVDTMFAMKGATTAKTEASATAAVDPSPLNAYVTHEWAARQMVMERQLASAPERVDKDGKRELPVVAPVDEGLVVQLAESAAAVSIDDQMSADPHLLVGKSVHGPISVSLTAAVHSVQQVTAVLSTTVNIRNENAFAPKNNVAPVVNVYPHEPKPNANLCTEGGLNPDTASCMKEGNGYLLRLKTFYDSGACDNPAVQGSMAELGAAVRRLAVANGQTYYAHVSGYASQRPSERLQCGIARKRAADRCTYWNLAREEVRIGNCAATSRGRDANDLLSAGRATHAAQALETAADGSLLIKSLAAHGTSGARIHAGNDDIDADRSVVIRLWPASSR